ncbi:hypothetical protein PAPYR_1952 [Paratrimastix pyriformis]|uniref:MYND-type domain-containing protein n=1 Tax=Paratrimastix pyriformis TaxID=342808 RepID=A0ABQ8US87_9EUKA|nr:hypothetical protein PAPYR_1952 [Paratrimastix pyriformis]
MEDDTRLDTTCITPEVWTEVHQEITEFAGAGEDCKKLTRSAATIRKLLFSSIPKEQITGAEVLAFLLQRCGNFVTSPTQFDGLLLGEKDDEPSLLPRLVELLKANQTGRISVCRALAAVPPLAHLQQPLRAAFLADEALLAALHENMSTDQPDRCPGARGLVALCPREPARLQLLRLHTVRLLDDARRCLGGHPMLLEETLVMVHALCRVATPYGAFLEAHRDSLLPFAGPFAAMLGMNTSSLLQTSRVIDMVGCLLRDEDAPAMEAMAVELLKGGLAHHLTRLVHLHVLRAPAQAPFRAPWEAERRRAVSRAATLLGMVLRHPAARALAPEEGGLALKDALLDLYGDASLLAPSASPAPPSASAPVSPEAEPLPAPVQQALSAALLHLGATADPAALVEAGPSDFARCGRCRCVRYCGRECQRADWAAHKAFCWKQESAQR